MPGAAARRLACILMISWTSQAWPHDGTISATVGFDYSTGDYGEASDTDVVYVPLTVKYEEQRWTFKATLPWLHVRGPADAVLVDGRPLATASSTGRTSASGPGDITGSAGYTVIEDFDAGVIVDIVGKVKLPTADETRGLGSGKSDYAAQVDALKILGDWSVLGSVGYRWLGDPAGIELRDVWYASAGVVRTVSPDWTGGVLYDYRESASDGGAVQSEATLYAVHRLDAQLRLQTYVVRGFADGSPDWEVGAALTRRF